MTDDRLERLREQCEGKKDITIPALDLLNIIDMVQSYGAEIDRLHEERARWQKQFRLDNAALKSADDEITRLRDYEKVVGLMEYYRDKGWLLWDIDALNNNLDIAKMKEGV